MTIWIDMAVRVRWIAAVSNPWVPTFVGMTSKVGMTMEVGWCVDVPAGLD
jgi:hypothetical protein